MTQEEKARAYDKALERAKTMIDDLRKGDDILSVSNLEAMFPELAESEDEKTKRMLDIITYKMSQHQPDIFTGEENEWFNDWIEKQGQTFTKKDVDDVYLKGICVAKHELEKQGEKGTKGNEREIPNSEQKPAWSEEDETIALSIEQVMNCASLLNIVPEKIDKIRTWLKSLKDRYTWKPSEEQIKVCKKVYADVLSAKGFYLGFINNELNRLEEELKKLKG